MRDFLVVEKGGTEVIPNAIGKNDDGSWWWCAFERGHRVMGANWSRDKAEENFYNGRRFVVEMALGDMSFPQRVWYRIRGLFR